eukprot:g2572.t1
MSAHKRIKELRRALRKAKEGGEENEVKHARRLLKAAKAELRERIVAAVGEDAAVQPTEAGDEAEGTIRNTAAHSSSSSSSRDDNVHKTLMCKVATTPKRRRCADGLYPCTEWTRTGACKYGDACKFSHLPPEESQADDDSNNNNNKIIVRKRKRQRTLPCFDFIDGKCERGSLCRYRHVSEEEGRETVEYKVAKILSRKSTQEEKLLELMKLPVESRQKARAIFFAKQRTSGYAGGSSQRKKERPSRVCFAFQSGECTRGDQCKFEHTSTKNGAVGGGEKATEALR